MTSNMPTETRSKAAGAGILTTSNAAPAFGQAVTLTDTIPVVNGIAPTGAASYYHGTTLSGTATPNASGIATLATTALPVGVDSSLPYLRQMQTTRRQPPTFSSRRFPRRLALTC